MKKRILCLLISVITVVIQITASFSMGNSEVKDEYLTKAEFNSKMDDLERSLAEANVNYKADIATSIVDYYKNSYTNPFVAGEGAHIITEDDSRTGRTKWGIETSYSAMPYFTKRGPWHTQDEFVSVTDFIMALLETHRVQTQLQNKTRYHLEGYLNNSYLDTSDSKRFANGTNYNEGPFPYASPFGSLNAWVIIDYNGTIQPINGAVDASLIETDTTKGKIHVKVYLYDDAHVMNSFAQYVASLDVEDQQFSGWRQVGSEIAYFNWFDKYTTNQASTQGLYDRFTTFSYSFGSSFQNNNKNLYFKHTNGVWALCRLGTTGTGYNEMTPMGYPGYYLVHAVPFFKNFGNAQTKNNTNLGLNVTAYSYDGKVYQYVNYPSRSNQDIYTNNPAENNTYYGEWIRLDQRDDACLIYNRKNFPYSDILTTNSSSPLLILNDTIDEYKLVCIKLNETMYYYEYFLKFTLEVRSAIAAGYSTRTKFFDFNSYGPYFTNYYFSDLRLTRLGEDYEYLDNYDITCLDFYQSGRAVTATNWYGGIPVGTYPVALSFGCFTYDNGTYNYVKSSI